MSWTVIFAILTAALYLSIPFLDLRAIRRGLGIVIFLQLFYLIGYYLADWPFPTPTVILQLFITVGLGVALGATFSKVWPLAPNPGFERIVRTLLIVIPSLGLGIGLQVLLQGPTATQAIYLIFALSAWLGSGQFVRQENGDDANGKKEKNGKNIK